MGDFNSRVDLPHDEHEEHGEVHDLKTCKPHKEAMENSNYKKLAKFDNFNTDSMSRKNDFNAFYFGFTEGKIELFGPTFKLKEGTDIYKTKRTPAWCDRIIYRSAKKDDNDVL